MNLRRFLFVCVLVISGALFSAPTRASTIGIAVDGIMGNAIGNTLVSRPLLGGQDAIEYFIPLDGQSDVYGFGNTNGNDGFGQVSDFGNGGGVLQMFLEFSPVSTTSPSVMTVHFEDLDLIGANDPNGFLEEVDVVNAAGISLLMGGPIENIMNMLVTGADDTQILTLALGVLAADPLYLRLDFTAGFVDPWKEGTNTAEYLIAKVTPVPLPAALPLFAGGLGLLGLLGWRRKRTSAA